MNDSKHTPTPWGRSHRAVTIEGRARPIGLFNTSEDAELCRVAVNSFDAMREALESIAKFDHGNHPVFGDEAGGKVTVDALAEIARAALALAGGEA